jgi:hypothetical protein
VIALPNCLHEEAALAELAAGYHVLCEKPLALTEAGCRRIAAAAEAAGRVAAVGMVRRLTAASVALREALAAGLVGAVRRIDIEDGAYYPWLSDSGAFFRPENGGILADMGVHYLDLAADLFGPLEPVRYHDDWRGGCEANAEYHLLAPGGLPVRLRLSRDRTLKNRFLVEGERDRPSPAVWNRPHPSPTRPGRTTSPPASRSSGTSSPRPCRGGAPPVATPPPRRR